MPKVGILYDNISGNTGDVAIGLSIKKFLEEILVPYEELIPGRFNPRDYEKIIIGGGHLLRLSPHFFYDKFKIRGNHILNSCGIVDDPDDLQYLDDYEYISVRSTGDKRKLEYLKKYSQIKVIPCTSMLLEDLDSFKIPIKEPSLGIHLRPGIIKKEEEQSFIEWLSGLGLNIYFLPITFYEFDFLYMKMLSMGTDFKVMPVLNAKEIYTIIGKFNYFISSSLHGSIFSYMHNVPFLSFDIEKNRFFMEDRHIDNYLFSNFYYIKNIFDKLLDNHPDYQKYILKDKNILNEHIYSLKNLLKNAQSNTVFTKNSNYKNNISNNYLINTLESGINKSISETHKLKDTLNAKDIIINNLLKNKQHNNKTKSNYDKLMKNILLNDQIDKKNILIKNLTNEYKNIKLKLFHIQNSLGWNYVLKYRYMTNRYMPRYTIRRKILEYLFNQINEIINHGFKYVLINNTKNVYYNFIEYLTKIDKIISMKTGISVGLDRRFINLNLKRQYEILLLNNRLNRNMIREKKNNIVNFKIKPKISIVMPVYKTNIKWLDKAIKSILLQIYDDWELCIVDDGSQDKKINKLLDNYNKKYKKIKIKYLNKNFGISETTNHAINMTEGEFIGFLDHDDKLTEDALYEVVKCLNENSDLDLIYTDEDKINTKEGRYEPFFKPDWSPDLLLSMNYISHFTVIRKNILEKAGKLRKKYDGSQDYDLILRITEITDKIAHIPKPLYNWRATPGSAAMAMNNKPHARQSAKKALQESINRKGLNCEILDGFIDHYRVKYEIKENPLISIIIPTKDKVQLLKKCIESIENKTLYKNYEIIIIDNTSIEENTFSYYKTLHHKVVKFNEPFNYSRINNFGSKIASGEHLLFLNNDIQIIDGNWLHAMLEHSQRKEIGMVGALLLYPDKNKRNNVGQRIQHAGVILGVGGTANHAFRSLAYEGTNYLGLHRVVRNCSAVTTACAMIRKNVFDEINGFNEIYKVAYGDVDLCLRLREKGYFIVYTPYAKLLHIGSATRGELHPIEDEEFMISSWKDTLIKGDPYYNPNLTLIREDYSLSPTGYVDRPLSILLELYYLRTDLQKHFPNVEKGDYQRLIDWAAMIAIENDKAGKMLRPYESYYHIRSSISLERDVH